MDPLKDQLQACIAECNRTMENWAADPTPPTVHECAMGSAMNAQARIILELVDRLVNFQSR